VIPMLKCMSDKRAEMLTHKFRQDPTKAQEKKLVETLETCRGLYNQMLHDRIRNIHPPLNRRRSLLN
jgi:hypothetical protein